MKVYKGADKNMQCCGFQYEIGKTVVSDDAIRCGSKGFHSCEAPFDVLNYYPMRCGNRYFEAEADGKIDRTGAEDSKIASSELTLKAEVGLPSLVKAQIAYTRKKAENGTSGGDDSNLAGGKYSNLVVGEFSNLTGGSYSNIAGGSHSNLTVGNHSNLAGGSYSNIVCGRDSNIVCGSYSNLVGGNHSNLVSGDYSNLVGGYGSNLVSGDGGTLAGGDYSNLVGGRHSLIAGGYGGNLVGGYGSNLVGDHNSSIEGGGASILVGRNCCRVRGKKNSVLVLTEWENSTEGLVPIHVKAEIVDGERIKADTWYRLVDGKLVEA